MARNLWLALAEDIHEVANADFSIRDEVQQAKPGAIGKGSKKVIERGGCGLNFHLEIIYGLTDMCNAIYKCRIRVCVYVYVSWRPYGKRYI